MNVFVCFFVFPGQLPVVISGPPNPLLEGSYLGLACYADNANDLDSFTYLWRFRHKHQSTFVKLSEEQILEIHKAGYGSAGAYTCSMSRNNKTGQANRTVIMHCE